VEVTHFLGKPKANTVSPLGEPQRALPPGQGLDRIRSPVARRPPDNLESAELESQKLPRSVAGNGKPTPEEAVRKQVRNSRVEPEFGGLNAPAVAVTGGHRDGTMIRGCGERAQRRS
jgi:hypothetical protein